MSWTSKGKAVSSAGNVPILRLVSHPQLQKVDALILALQAARGDADKGLFFASQAGKAAVNAAFDLFECDDLYKLKQDVAHELGESDDA